MEYLKIKLLVDRKIVEETLERIGIANKVEKVLYPSCYIWDDNFGNTFLVHFKQLFLIYKNSGYNNISEDDLIRRNAIAFCLKNWKLIDVDDEDIKQHDKFIFVLPFYEKMNYLISHKFNISILKGV